MRRLSFRFLILLPLLASTGFAQTTSTDSQTLQALLLEMRQLRQDLRTTTVASERAHILIYGLQSKEGAMARAQQKLDEARSKLASAQDRRQALAAQIKNFEDRQEGLTPLEQKEMAGVITQFKSQLELALPEIQEAQTSVSECEERVRREQAALDELQGQLDQLDNALKRSERPVTVRSQGSPGAIPQ